jgi:hypothetical protein
MKSFGLFNIIRGILRAVMGLVGGVMANRISVQKSYAVLGAYPIVMIVYTLLIFKEERVSQFYSIHIHLTFLEKSLVQQSQKSH